MCVGFLPLLTHTLPQRVGEHTNSVTRDYAGYNINPLSVDPADNGQHKNSHDAREGRYICLRLQWCR